MSAQPLTSSPATSLSSLSDPFKKGQQIAYIYNRTDLVTGIITAINPDSTYDLTCDIPMRLRQVKLLRGYPQITFKTVLDSRPFLRVSPADPRMQTVKSVRSLESIGVPLPGPNSLIQQSSTMTWVDSGHRARVPRLTEFLAPLVGHFFDPALFFYRITCWRAQVEIRGQGTIPEEIRVFPNPSKKPYYSTFATCFSRYLKEYHENLEKWDRVTMEAILPEDILPKEEEKADA